MKLPVPLDTRLLVLERDEWSCVRCSISVGEHRLYAIHHRFSRGMGGGSTREINDPRNLVTLCGLDNRSDCHGWVHQHPEQALDAGFTLAQLLDWHRCLRTIVDSLVTLHADGTRDNQRTR